MRHILASAFKVPAPEVHVYIPDIHTHEILTAPVEHGGRKHYFYKSHSKEEVTRYKDKTINNETIIYIKRHPLDVFISFVNYMSKSVTNDGKNVGFCVDYDSADQIKGTDVMDILFNSFCLYGTLLPGSKEFGSWFENVENFTKLSATDNRVIVVAYEQLITDFPNTIQPVFERLGLPMTMCDEVHQAADSATSQNGAFFWKRKANNYLDYLSPKHIDLFRKLHGESSAHLGYSI